MFSGRPASAPFTGRMFDLSPGAFLRGVIFLQVWSRQASLRKKYGTPTFPRRFITQIILISGTSERHYERVRLNFIIKP
jgi:hypothetical protein